MLEAALSEQEGRSIAAMAAEIGLPRATAHRQLSTLVAEQYLVRLPDGRFAPGIRLIAMLRHLDEAQPVIAAAAPVLHRLAGQIRSIAQLGTLDGDMVTYRIKTGQGAGNLFTKVGMQLEAYCTGIGKVLLANLPKDGLEAYLASGPFPALTSTTITRPEDLRRELVRVRQLGFAVDDGEIAEGLFCIAVPIRALDSSVVAAISVSLSSPVRDEPKLRHLVDQLKLSAGAIEQVAYPVQPV